MILLKSIDARQRSADLQPLDTTAASNDELMAPVMTAARALGLLQLRMHDSLGSHEDLLLPAKAISLPPVDPCQCMRKPSLEGMRAERTSKELDAVLYGHQGSVRGDHIDYEAHFAHQRMSPPLIASYVSLLLATIGTHESQILQFRLAMYEMCANVVEHGTLQQSPAEIGIHLALTPGEVHGWIQDGCDYFDLSAQPTGNIREHAETRAARGYGIHMMHQLLESIDHEFNTTGNRIHFRKRIAP